MNLLTCCGALSYWNTFSSQLLPHHSKLFSSSSFKMSTWSLKSMLPSILVAYPIPFHDIHPHILILPPPNFKVPWTVLLLSLSPFFFYTHFLPSDLIQLILVSSDQMTLFQSSRVSSLCCITKSIPALQCFLVSTGHLTFTAGIRPARCQIRSV